MPDAIDRFRTLTGRRRRRKSASPAYRPRIPTREIYLLSLIFINILWLVYALGGVRLWGVSTAAGLSLLTLLFLPKWNSGELPGTARPALELLRLPLFWCGMALMGLFFIHSWNISWVWKAGPGGGPTMVPVEPRFSWLPSGWLTPLEENNAFRSMMFYVIPWLTACAIWVGLMTRRSLAYLLHGTAIIGVAFAIFAMWQHFTEAEKIFGIFESSSRGARDIRFWGSLFNANHAAYLLILINGLCQGLFLTGWRKDIEVFRYSGGIWVLYFAGSLVVTFSTLLAQSRGAIAFLILQWLIFLVLCSIFFTRRFGKKGLLLPLGVFATMVVIGLSFVTNPDVYENQRQDWNKTFDLMQNPEFEARYYMAKISWDLISERPWMGHGAGSWRYAHLPHLAKYPEFRTVTRYWTRSPETNERVQRTRVVWFQNAHVDLAEYVVEWGILGAALPFFAMLWLLYRFIRVRQVVDLGAIAILSGVLLVWVGAAIEFHFRIPLVLLVWCIVFTALVRYMDRQARFS